MSAPQQALLGQQSDAAWIPRVGAGSSNWIDLSTSSDGKSVFAVGSSGLVQSTNFGGIWQGAPTGYQAKCVDCSSDGLKALAAFVTGEAPKTSSNGGANWGTGGITPASWSGVDMSAAGDTGVLIISAMNSQIARFTGGGGSWSPIGSSLSWIDATVSSDGIKIVAVESNGYLYTSINSGTTFVQQTAFGSRAWGAVSISPDGSKIVAAAASGQLYRSTDGGATCAAIGPTAGWKSLDQSTDGTTIIAASSTYVHVSTDSGSSFTQQSVIGSRDWRVARCSADGSIRHVAAYGDYIYTYI